MRLEEVKKLYQEMQLLMLELRTLGEIAAAAKPDSDEFKALDSKARPIIERYVELQHLIPNQKELYELESQVLLRDKEHGYLQ